MQITISEHVAGPTSGPDQPVADDSVEVAISVNASANFAELLDRHRVSLLLSTYDLHKLIILRGAGNALNVHLVNVRKAMGIAANERRIAVGTKNRVQHFFNMPGLCSKLPPSPSHPSAPDACYVPRGSHITGDIDIHEMAWAGDELWMVNTRFSCLCTLDPNLSFVPRWRPPFVAGLSADDRCHLNGLAMDNDSPAYVTAFAVSDEPAGWRPQRTTGGILVDVASGEIVAQGLSMPHSPRVHGNDLWLLDSGRGGLARVDRGNGKTDTMAELPGFTRGLDFAGNLAFVGLSQTRQSNVFGGLPLTDRLSEEERFCGIQVVNLITGRRKPFSNSNPECTRSSQCRHCRAFCSRRFSTRTIP